MALRPAGVRGYEHTPAAAAVGLPAASEPLARLHLIYTLEITYT